jgi:hypothetical protein
MPCRYSFNKKERKKGKKAKPVRYISTCVETEKLFLVQMGKKRHNIFVFLVKAIYVQV